MAIAWEKGFKRITAVLSGIIAVIGVFLVCVDNGERGVLFLAALLFTALPWGIFYTVRWITLGFLDKPEFTPVTPDLGATSAPQGVTLQSTPEPPSVNEIMKESAGAKSKRRSLRETWWPTIASEQDATKCISTAVGTALFVAVTTGLLSVLALFGHPVLGMTGAGLADAAMFLLLAYGTHKRSRVAATSLVLLYVVEAIVSKRFTIIQMMFLLLLSNGMRGIFYLHRDRPFAIILPRTQWIKRALVVGAIGLSLLVALTAELFLETKLNKPFLLTGFYHIISPRLTGELQSPTGDYALSFKDTKLEWRRQPSFMVKAMASGKGPVLYLVGYPGLQCTVFEETGDLDKLQDVQLAASLFSKHTDKGGKISGYLDVPGAVKDKFFMFEDKLEGEKKPFIAVEGLYRLPPTKLVIMRFNIYEPTDGTPIDSQTITHDIELVSKSFKTLVAAK